MASLRKPIFTQSSDGTFLWLSNTWCTLIHISFSKSTVICLFIKTNTLKQWTPYKIRVCLWCEMHCLEVTGILTWQARPCGKNYTRANFVDLIASTNGRRPMLAMELAACCKTLVFSADQLSHLHCLLTCCMFYSCAVVHMHAQRRHALSPFFSNRLPLTCTQAAAGFADVCPRSASNTGYSHACVLTLTFPHSLMKWETETLEPSSSPSAWQLTWF